MLNSPKIQLLGTGTGDFNPKRMCSSVLVELEEGRFVFDFGRGIIHRLFFDLHYKPTDIDTIWISHFHPDHITDLIPFFHAISWSKSAPKNFDYPIRIIGPTGIKEFWNGLLASFPMYHVVREELLPHVNIIELPESKFTLFKTEFSLKQLPHENNTAIKFNIGDKSIVLCGDSPFSEAEISFISDSDIAIIDAKHKTDHQLVQTAVYSRAKRLILTHNDREIDAESINKDARSIGYLGEIIVGEDLMELKL